MKRLVLAISAAALVAAAGYGWWQYTQNQWIEKKLEDPSVALAYHKDFVEKPKDEFIFRAEVEGLNKTPALISIRKETGLRIVTSLTKGSLIENLLRNAERAYPQRYPEYKKLSERKLKAGDHDAAELYFTYQGPVKETIKQRLLIVEYDPGTAIYITGQSKESDFEKVNKKYLNRMFASVSF